MKLKDLTVSEAAAFVRADAFEEEKQLRLLLDAARSYILSYTGLDEEAAGESEDLALAALVLCSDAYDNRQMSIDRQNVNRTIETILNMHAVNLL